MFIVDTWVVLFWGLIDLQKNKTLKQIFTDLDLITILFQAYHVKFYYLKNKMILFLIVFIRTNENIICRMFSHMSIIWRQWLVHIFMFSCKTAYHLWKQILQELFLRRGDSSCVGGNKGNIWRKLSELFLKISETSSRCLWYIV